MEVNAVETVTNVTGKFWLQDIIEASLIVNGAGLVELSEQGVEVKNGSRVHHKLVPVCTLGHHLVLVLEFRDDFLEIPWEGKNITVLLLAENNISTHSLVVCFDTSLFLLGLWSLYRRSTEHPLCNLDSS